MDEDTPRPNYEEPYLGLARDGSVLMTAGEVLIIMAALPVSFLYNGMRVGSDFCLFWALIQGGLGVLLVIIGAFLQHKREAPGKPGLERWILSEETEP